MSLRTFLYAADALRLEEGVGFVVDTPAGVTAPAVPSPADARERNAQAMAALTGIMGGVQKKGARR